MSTTPKIVGKDNGKYIVEHEDGYKELLSAKECEEKCVELPSPGIQRKDLQMPSEPDPKSIVGRAKELGIPVKGKSTDALRQAIADKESETE